MKEQSEENKDNMKFPHREKFKQIRERSEKAIKKPSDSDLKTQKSEFLWNVVKDQLLGPIYQIDSELENLEKKMKEAEKDSPEYAKLQKQAEQMVAQAEKIPEALESYIKKVTAKSNGRITPEVLSQMCEEADEIVGLMTKPEMQELYGIYLWATNEASYSKLDDQENFKKLIDEISGSEGPKKDYAILILTFLSSNKRVEFAKKYIQEKRKNGNEKKLLVELNRKGGISPMEMEEALDGYAKLTKEELEKAIENWKASSEYKKFAKELSKKSAAGNIGDEFTIKNLLALFLKVAGGLGIVLNVAANIKAIVKSPVAILDTHVPLASAYFVGGKWLSGSLDLKSGKTAEAERKKGAFDDFLDVLNSSPHGWGFFFKKDQNIDAFAEYVRTRRVENKGKLKLSQLKVGDFQTFLIEQQTKSKKPEIYKEVSKNFGAVSKDAGVNDETLQRFAVIFDALEITDFSKYGEIYKQVRNA